MKLLRLLVLLLCTSPAWATFSLVQEGHNLSCSSASSCVITPTSSIGSGHLLVFEMDSVHGSNVLITAAATGAGNMVLCPSSGCHAFNSNINLDAGYILSSSSSATLTVTVNGSVAVGWQAFFKEYAYTSGPISLDTFGLVTNLSCSTTCPGIALSLTGTNDAIFQHCTGGPNCTGVSSPYSGDVDIAGGSGFAASPNTVSGTAPSWSLDSSGKMIFNALAFTETFAPTSGGKRPLVF